MKYFKAIISFLLISILLVSCSEIPANINTDITDNYIEAIEKMDFASAHDCFWKHADYVSEETYLEDCNYLVEKLGIESITVDESSINIIDETPIFSYTVTLHTKDAGDITSKGKTQLILEKGKTYINYTSDMLLADYEHGDVITCVTLSGSRGEIFTEDGKVVAQNSFADTVYFDVTSDVDFKTTITKVDSILDLSEKELTKIKKDYDSAVENGYGSVKIRSYSRGTINKKLYKQLSSIEGIGIDDSSMTYQRYYPDGKKYCHVLGYANSPDEEQTKELEAGGYSSLSVWGKEGIEKVYNKQMLSKDGYTYQLRKETYEIKRTLFTKEAENGKDVILTINSSLQEAASSLLESELDEDQAGAVVVLNGKTGGVLAQSSAPDFDINLFSSGISEEDYKALTDNKLAPLYNRVNQGLYPPGSTIKPFTATASLKAGKSTFADVFPYAISENSWTPENWHWLPVKRDEYVAPPLTMYKAMVHSDNIYFAWLGLESGFDTIADYFTSIGIGESVNYELPTAKSNLINDDAGRNGTMLADMSFGHGQILLTPIQVACMYTAFQNDGDILNPYLVSALGSEGEDGYVETTEHERSVWKAGAVPESYIPTFNKMFEGVVNEGTAALLLGTGKKVYAKTGTAIKGDEKDKRISWVVAWLPESEDNRIVLVLIETPANKGNVKFSVAKPLLAMD